MHTALQQPQSTRRIKSFSPLQFKAVGQQVTGGETLKDGEFIALAAVFGNVDSYGERMAPTAFDETLAAWEAKGDPIPVIWYHNWTDPFANIGGVQWARATEEGLLYKGAVDLDNPFAAQVYRLMKARRVTQQSFGFDILDAAEIVEDGKSIFEIRKAALFEVGPCLVGVNQATELLDIKSMSEAGGSLPAPEPSGQVTPAAEDSSPSEAPASTPNEPPASKGLSPASVLLSLEIQSVLGGTSDE